MNLIKISGNTIQIISEAQHYYNTLSDEIKFKFYPKWDEFVSLKQFIFNCYTNRTNDPELQTKLLFVQKEDLEKKFDSMVNRIISYEKFFDTSLNDLKRILELSKQNNFTKIKETLAQLNVLFGQMEDVLKQTRAIVRFFISKGLYTTNDPETIPIIRQYIDRRFNTSECIRFTSKKSVLIENLDQVMSRIFTFPFAKNFLNHYYQTEYTDDEIKTAIDSEKMKSISKWGDDDMYKIYKIHQRLRLIYNGVLQTINSGITENKFSQRTQMILANWIISRIMTNKVLWEDIGQDSKASEYFLEFFQNNQKFKDYPKDINQYPDLASIFVALKQFRQIQYIKFDPTKVPNTKTILNNDQLTIIQPLTAEASCILGKNTEWCTAKYSPNDERNMFDYYNAQSPLYIFFDKKTGKRYQYHEKSNQFMNEDDQIETNNIVNHYLEILETIIYPMSQPEIQSPLLTPETIPIIRQYIDRRFNTSECIRFTSKKSVLTENLDQVMSRIFTFPFAKRLLKDYYPFSFNDDIIKVAIDSEKMKQISPASAERIFHVNKFLKDFRQSVLDTINSGITENKFSQRTQMILANWIISRIMTNKVLWEDIGKNSKASEYFLEFFQNNQKFKNHPKDINQYPDLASIFVALKQFRQTQHIKFDPTKVPNTKIILNNDELTIVQPLTTEASCILGKNTEWCTAKYQPNDKRNMFDHYNAQSPLYIFFDKKTGKRYQYHEKSNQFMNEDDQEETNNIVNHYLEILETIIYPMSQPEIQSPLLTPEIINQLHKFARHLKLSPTEQQTMFNFYVNKGNELAADSPEIDDRTANLVYKIINKNYLIPKIVAYTSGRF